VHVEMSLAVTAKTTNREWGALVLFIPSAPVLAAGLCLQQALTIHPAGLLMSECSLMRDPSYHGKADAFGAPQIRVPIRIRFLVDRTGKPRPMFSCRCDRHPERSWGIYCQLFSGAKGFPKKVSKTPAVVRAPIQDGSATCAFPNVSPCAYAVAVHHDENGNGRLDRGFMGIPKEGVGVSN
jgi:hypothetical protein